MNKDQVGGKVEQVTGHIKEKIGDAVGNQKMANEGMADQVKGAAKETWGKAKEAAHDIEERHRHELAQKAASTREKVVGSVKDLKDKIKTDLDDKTRKPA